MQNFTIRYLISYPLNRQGVGEAKDSHLRRTVVSLSKVAVKSSTGTDVDDSSVLLTLHDRPHGMAERRPLSYRLTDFFIANKTITVRYNAFMHSNESKWSDVRVVYVKYVKHD